MSAKELELTLDGAPIEYPALVKEAFLNNWHTSALRSEVTSNSASLDEKYCWVLSRNQMFIWETGKTSSHRASIPKQLPLPTSGLPRSVKCVVVYKGLQRSAGVLIVSPEGVLRHWTSIDSQNFFEKVLDINSEVALRVELVDSPEEGKTASFLLTTTSGTIYFIHGDNSADASKTGALQAHKVTGKESEGLRRRLSSIMFGGGSKESDSLVSNSFLHDDNDLLVVTVASKVLTVYNVTEPCEVWSLRTKDFFQPMVAGFFEADLKKPVAMPKAKLIDAAVFRGGLMVLIGGTHEDSSTVHLFVTWLAPGWSKDQPKRASWSAKVPVVEHRALFSKNDDSIYSSLTLCITPYTATAKTAERTDGIIIVNPFFVMSLYVPFDLENPKKNDVSSYKLLSLPATDQLIGCSIGNQYVSLLLLDAGVSTVRLLPRGFSDGSVLYTQEQVVVPSVAAGSEDWTVLSELLSEMLAAGLPKSPVLRSLHRAFELFGEKNMVKSAAELKPLVELADQEMSRVVEQFMYAIVDYSDAANKTEMELHAKRVLTARMMLFLKHMGLFERVVLSIIPQSKNALGMRSGGAMLAEMAERVAATSAVWSWRNRNEVNGAVFDSVIEKVLRLPDVQELGLKDKDALFGRCGMLHHIPVVAARQLDPQALGKAKAHRFEVFHSVCDLLMAIKEAVLTQRSYRTKVSIPKTPIGWWTTDMFIECYREVSERIVAELREGSASDSERTRLLLYVLGIYDFYLGENPVQPDNDKLLQDLINLGKLADAMDLAERHRDFGTLVRNYLATDPMTRQKNFERFKQMFDKDDFEMYLCEYLKKHGRNDVLLEQAGKRVDAYLDNFKELRYSREIANKQFGKAALTLMSLADAEVKSFARFSEYLTRAHYCASSTRPSEGVDVSEVLDFYRRRLPEMRHRQRMPVEILKTGYGNDLDVMMSVEDMLEWNMANQPNDTATIEGFARAFHLLADLVEVFGREAPELREKVDKTWRALVEYDEWSQVRKRDDVENKTMLGRFCEYLVGTFPRLDGDSLPMWPAASRRLIMPLDTESMLDESSANTTGHHTSWIKGHVKWAADRLDKLAAQPKAAFFRPDTQFAGSFALAALDGFGPILERRRQRMEKVCQVPAN